DVDVAPELCRQLASRCDQCGGHPLDRRRRETLERTGERERALELLSEAEYGTRDRGRLAVTFAQGQRDHGPTNLFIWSPRHAAERQQHTPPGSLVERQHLALLYVVADLAMKTP